MAPSICPSCSRPLGQRGGCSCRDGMYWALLKDAPKPAPTRTASTRSTAPLPDLDPMFLMSRAGQAELGPATLPAPLPHGTVDFDTLMGSDPVSDDFEFSGGADIELVERPGRAGRSTPPFRVDRPPVAARYEPGEARMQDGRVVGNIREALGRPQPGTPIAEVRTAAIRPAPRPAPPVIVPTAYERLGQVGDDDPFS